MRVTGIVVFLVAVILCLPVVGMSQIISNTWYFNDGPGTTYWWGDADPQLGAFWEWMGPNYLAPDDTVCAYADVLQPPQEYYAASQVEASTMYAGNYWAEIYLSNNYSDHNNPVYAAIGYGTPGNPSSFVQVGPTVTANVINFTIGCGLQYTFDFGLQYITLTNQAIIIKIWTTVPPGDVHVYWDAHCCPSALFLDSSVPVKGESWGAIKQLFGE